MGWIFVAIISGLLGGMGMGGGTLYIPALTLFFGVPQRLAQWLNLVSFVPMSAVVLGIHAKNKNLDGRAFWPLFLPSLLAALPCAYFAGQIRSAWLGFGFGVFMSVLGVIGLVVAAKNGIKYLVRNTPKQPANIGEDN